MTPPIQLSEVVFAYSHGTGNVLEGLSLTVHAGERVGLTGPNGAGKTSLLRLIVGLERPASGSICLFGVECSGEPDFAVARRRIGLTFQDPDDQLFCPTVQEDVAFGPRNLGLGEDEVSARVTDSLEQCGAAHLASRLTYALSMGEKRLVALAGIVAMKPDVLLLDETTTGLDPASEARVAGLLANNGAAQVIVSHDRAFLERTATRTTVLEHGRLHG